MVDGGGGSDEGECGDIGRHVNAGMLDGLGLVWAGWCFGCFTSKHDVVMRIQDAHNIIVMFAGCNGDWLRNVVHIADRVVLAFLDLWLIRVKYMYNFVPGKHNSR